MSLPTQDTNTVTLLTFKQKPGAAEVEQLLGDPWEPQGTQRGWKPADLDPVRLLLHPQALPSWVGLGPGSDPADKKPRARSRAPPGPVLADRGPTALWLLRLDRAPEKALACGGSERPDAPFREIDCSRGRT
ncbi:hypothetical protein H920_15577 [Fukomys damarensis]|uniref:Uncharacterized protein n=1 Tax=Fukomys damarensis TaxID=885580 RepID=A0A091CYQ5_FUKDA|nr:hypothetical protein H920_15577 [Fukomys damarensis]